MSKDWKIRAALPSDLDGIWEVYFLRFGMAPPRAAIEGALQNPSVRPYLVAESKGHIMA